MWVWQEITGCVSSCSMHCVCVYVWKPGRWQWVVKGTTGNVRWGLDLGAGGGGGGGLFSVDKLKPNSLNGFFQVKCFSPEVKVRDTLTAKVSGDKGMSVICLQQIHPAARGVLSCALFKRKTLCFQTSLTFPRLKLSIPASNTPSTRAVHVQASEKSFPQDFPWWSGQTRRARCALFSPTPEVQSASQSVCVSVCVCVSLCRFPFIDT